MTVKVDVTINFTKIIAAFASVGCFITAIWLKDVSAVIVGMPSIFAAIGMRDWAEKKYGGK